MKYRFKKEILLSRTVEIRRKVKKNRIWKRENVKEKEVEKTGKESSVRFRNRIL
jgi:hypothetical protein